MASIMVGSPAADFMADDEQAGLGLRSLETGICSCWEYLIEEC